MLLNSKKSDLMFMNKVALSGATKLARAMINVYSDLVSRCSYKSAIDPFNKFNIYSFPLLTSYSAFVILLKAYSFNDANNGKLYILDLLKGSRLTLEFLIRSVNLCKFMALCPDKLYPLFLRNILR